ncbi:SulP family inorganic anion transporter [Solirubrobacter taibaiensis]|nr:SulP family inorganic anion transporter [Solirubrobacter taibaiensis]
MRGPPRRVDDEAEASPAYAGSAFLSAEPEPMLHRAVPVAKELPSYRGETLQRDVTAALTVAALAIPSAMAYAEVAGLSAVHGLYALIAPAVAYAFLGSSKQLIVGPEGSLSALVAATVLGLAAAGSEEAAGLAAAMALIVAACFGLARVLNLGWVADYFSRPVLVGYIHGVAVVLVISQLGKLLGLDITARDPLPQLAEVVRELGSVQGTTLAVSAAALVLLIPARYLAPRLPIALVVVIGAIIATAWLDFDVATVGEIPAGLPGLEVPPLQDLATIVPGAIGLFLVCFADEILTARSFAGRRNQQVGVRQELVAMGAANAAAAFTQGLPVGASGSRTAVNDAVGARSQVSGLLAAAVVALVLLFLTAPIADLPKAVLGAVIVAACIGLIAPSQWRALYRTDRVELAIAAITTVGVIAVGVLPAIGIAVALSLVDVVRRSARPHDAVLGFVPRLGRYADVALHPSAQITPGVVVYRLDDRLFFANAGYVKGRVREALRAAPTPTHALVFDAEGVAHVDSAGLDALADISQLVPELHIARAKSPLQERLTPIVPPERFHPTVRAAVTHAG